MNQGDSKKSFNEAGDNVKKQTTLSDFEKYQIQQDAIKTASTRSNRKFGLKISSGYLYKK
jgi:hypothetical protein